MSETLELGDLPKDHISVSQIEMFRRCPQQYYIRYFLGVKKPPPGAMIIGTSAHKAMEHDMTQKMLTGENIKTEDAMAICADSFDKTVRESQEQAGGVDWNEEDPGAEKDSCIQTLKHYHETKANGINPTASEKPFEITFNESKMKLVGRIDTIHEDREIIDFKTTKMPKKRVEGMANNPTPIQLKVYKIANPQTQTLRLDYMIRKGPETASVVYTGEVDQDEVLGDIHKITTAIRTGIFYPNPGFDYLNCKMCAYTDKCPVWKGKVISA